MRKQHGFSLIELLLVVAIIMVIAAIAIPNLLRSRMAANEASAVSALHTINTAEVTYSATYPGLGFAVALSNLGGTSTQCASGVAITSANACIIDPVLTLGTKSGYHLAAPGGTPVGGITTTYVATANPTTPGTTGIRGFCSDQTGVFFSNSVDGSVVAASCLNAANFTVMQ
jgi:type IV pilus assembly protein PilA